MQDPVGNKYSYSLTRASFSIINKNCKDLFLNSLYTACNARLYTANDLRGTLQKKFPGGEVIVVSNSEPYLHTHTSTGITLQRPVSGVVTALESIISASAGKWIAHGSGSADRECTDASGNIKVPPEDPAYCLRRIWLNEKEKKGYYHGFSNEGLWPLCHIAHVRPSFKPDDWAQYQLVNQRFAQAVVEESRTDNPIVLVQDYHLALVPNLIRKQLPNATIISFWHIPWPSADMFAICPWREELLEGLLGSTIIGFQTPQHCDHFLKAVSTILHINSERSSVYLPLERRTITVKSYPISIEWPEENGLAYFSYHAFRTQVGQRFGIPTDQLLVLGVDRLDYTKGILERLHAFELLLEQHPEYIGKLVLLQIGSPTRGEIEQYQLFEEKVRILTHSINQRFSTKNYQAVILKLDSQDTRTITLLYRACQVCLVTSLHDGMNLVAKEFVAAREDNLGVLVLSEFTGASIELADALIINPYHLQQTADAIHKALNMSSAQQSQRMRNMRTIVENANIYSWAGAMLSDAAAHCLDSIRIIPTGQFTPYLSGEM